MPSPNGTVAGTAAAGSVTLDGQSYHLARAAGRQATVAGSWLPGDASQQNVTQGVPRVWNDWSGGGGYSRRDPRVPNGYAWCIGDPRFPSVFAPSGIMLEITPPAVPPAPTYDSFEANGAIWLTTGDRLVRIDQATAVATVEFVEPSGRIFLSALWFDGMVYLGTDGGPLYQFDPQDESITASSTVSREWLAVVYWVVDGYGAYRLIGTHQHLLQVYPADPTRTTNDPMVEDDWTAVYPVGGSELPIRRLAASSSHVYAVKADGIYDLDSRGFAPNLTPYWSQQLAASSGLSAMVHGDFVYACHILGLDRVRIGQGPGRDRPEWCQPGVQTAAETPIFGNVRAICVDGGWLVGAMFNGTDSYICYGVSRDQPGIQEGPGPLLWHTALAYLPETICTYMQVHAMGSPGNQTPWLLICGQDRTTGAVRFWRQQTTRAANPMQELLWSSLSDIDFEFADSATLVLPLDDWGDPTAVKMLGRFEIQADNLAERIAYVTVAASADGGSIVTIGDAIYSPRDVLAHTEGEPPTGYQIGVGLALHGPSDAPALLRALRSRALVRVDQLEQRVYRLQLGQATEGLNRARDRRDALSLYAQLVALQQRGAVEMTDHRGMPLLVIVTAVTSEETEVAGLAGRRWDIHAVVQMSVVSRPGYYDLSSYDTSVTYR